MADALARCKAAGIDIVTRQADAKVAAVEDAIAPARPLSMRINGWESRWPLNTYRERDASKLSKVMLERLAEAEAMTPRRLPRRARATRAGARALRRACRGMRRLRHAVGAGAAPVGLQSTGDPTFTVPASLLGIPAISLPVLEDRRPAARPAGDRLRQRGRRSRSPPAGCAIKALLMRRRWTIERQPAAAARRARALPRRAAAARAQLSRSARARARAGARAACSSWSTSRSTKTPRCIRWCAGSIAAASRSRTARRSCSRSRPIARAAASTSRCWSPGLAANRDVYRIGFGKPLEEIGATWVEAIAESDCAARRRPTRRARRS